MLSSESEKSNPTHAVLTVGMSAMTARLIPFVLILLVLVLVRVLLAHGLAVQDLHGNVCDTLQT